MSGNRGQTSVIQVVRALAPLSKYVRVLVQFGRNPVGFVASIISLYIINAVLNLGSMAINAVLTVFDIIVGSINYAESLWTGAGRAVGGSYLSVVADIQQAVGSVVAEAGLFGPPLAILFAAAIVFASYRLVIAILGELPLGSSIVDLLGLR